MLVSLECVLIIAIVFLWRFHIFDLTDKNENDITCCLNFSHRQILVQVLSGRHELSLSKRVECCLVQCGKLS